MTWKERLEKEKPEKVNPGYMGGCSGCPGEHFPEAKGIMVFESKCPCGGQASDDNCAKCWNSEIPGTKIELTVKTCTNCRYLSRDCDEEPCKSCDAKGHNPPTNWLYRDNGDLYYDRSTYTWRPKEQQVYKAYPRCNGKSLSALLDDAYNPINWPKTNPVLESIEKLTKAPNHHDGLSAQLFTIDELHNVKNTERKTDMPISNNWFPHGVTVRNGGSLTILPAALPEIEDVIFNPPATIVFWKDGTKTVVKANNEEYDPEKGLAMAMIKKLYGNKGNYCNKLRKWTDKYSGKYPAEKADETRANVSVAYDLLTTIRDSKKMTKSQMVCEIEDAIGYLGEALED